MDLTTLLNEYPFAVERQKREVMRLPTRSRTPWDAGGYSLPCSSARSTTSPTQSDDIEQPSPGIFHQTAFDDPYTSNAPNSPVHKATDSRSSLSSFTSSLHSRAHSRLSSISTVDSSYTLNNALLGQSLSPKPTMSQVLDEAEDSQSQVDIHSTPSMGPQTHDRLPPAKPSDTYSEATGQLNPETSIYSVTQTHNPTASSGETVVGTIRSPLTLPTRPCIQRTPAPEPGLPQDLPSRESETGTRTGSLAMEDDRSNVEARGGQNDIGDDRWLYERPSSPSDSLLIKRSTVPSTPMDIRGQYVGQSTGAQKQNLSSESSRQYLSADTRIHKRALSAPSFALNVPPSLGNEHNLLSSQSDDHTPSDASIDHPRPDFPRNTASGDPDAEPVCMYITDCDTGSQQRKAISHIFGRNKMCTRLIPAHVWVHLCRKHYQRSRYRNATAGYARVQCDLVQEQIRRIHDWSTKNLVNGRGPYVKNWTLALRKREQKRLLDQGGAKRKRAGSTQDESDGPSRDDFGISSDATAVPDWLLDLVGQEFGTEGILEVFTRLHQHIISVSKPFPDIEILPNVIVSQGETRTTVAKTHRHTQSLSAPHESSFRDHFPKRRRQNDLPLLNPTKLPLPQRPVYFNAAEPNDKETSLPLRRSSYQLPLSELRLQRGEQASMIKHLETGGAHSRLEQRPSHHRSQSDMSGFGRNFPNYHTYVPEQRLDIPHRSTSSGFTTHAHDVNHKSGPGQIAHDTSTYPTYTSERQRMERRMHSRHGSDSSGLGRGPSEYGSYITEEPSPERIISASYQSESIGFRPRSEHPEHSPERNYQVHHQSLNSQPYLRVDNQLGTSENPQGRTFQASDSMLHPRGMISVPSSYYVDSLGPRMRDPIQISVHGHSRHYSSPVIPHGEFSTASPSTHEHRLSPLPRTQSRPSIPRITEAPEYHESYGAQD